MDNELKQLLKLANGLLKGADVGREFTMEYVVARFEAALDEYPHDPVIRSVAQVIHKQASKGKLIASQKELYEIYNHFAGLSANSVIKEAVGDLLYPVSNAPKATTGNETAYTHRSNTPELDFKIEHNPLENIFDKNANATSYYDATLAKLGKHTLAQELNTIGVPATEIKVFAGNDYAIVYDVVFKNKLGTAHVAIPVDISGGVNTPTVFFNKNQFIDLTAENLNKYIVDVASSEEIEHTSHTGGVRTSSSIISPSFSFEEDAPGPIVMDRVAMPDALKDIVSYEEVLLDSSTPFSPELVRTAKALCNRELAGMGFRSQVSLSEATDNCIICSAELDSSVGKIEIRLPVEIIANRPQIPSLFYSESAKDKIYDFSKNELNQYLTSAKAENTTIKRYSNDFFNMTYNQLKEEIMTGVANKDYVRAEQALNRIEDQYGSDYHRAALSDYAKVLAASSIRVEDKPQHKCRLLISKGSIGPRCGHYNVSIARVITNEKGDCELVERKAKYENLAESTGALLRTNKITLT